MTLRSEEKSLKTLFFLLKTVKCEFHHSIFMFVLENISVDLDLDFFKIELSRSWYCKILIEVIVEISLLKFIFVKVVFK